MTITLNRTARRRLVALAAVSTGLLAGAPPAAAKTADPLTLQAVDGTADPDGSATFPSVEVTAPASKRTRTAPGSFTLRADDGSFPAAEQCEPATATVEIDGDRHTQMTLSATGTVCGVWAADEADPPIQRFVGRYAIVDGPPRFTGDDGFLNLVVGDGWSYLFAIDT